MRWEIKSFDELTTAELYAAIQLRVAVFVIEQNCPYQDLDYSDQKALHLMGYDTENRLAAYTRLFDKGIKYAEASIGRVVTASFARGKGAGRELMEESIKQIYQQFGQQPIRISAQQYLEKFYTSLGFKTVSEMYLEDDIPHVEMLKA
ncbi:GNAT family N-acetyltransferase [Chitinophaga sp. sic0106]|uniref:GNAT family N-acetyltransferase n=1 Tax=Chitinophaga sp. sic0106 TaxID=2854785 RepID=UPI001C437DBF|nr:GNAT family N-acetyltransferase [Chitinophaga sp. sic0106]MBV7531634.1 GNAT family N-acetyltransferase [Chitinophaga sp. sic0106]